MIADVGEALLIIDFQNDFTSGGALSVGSGRSSCQRAANSGQLSTTCCLAASAYPVSAGKPETWRGNSRNPAVGK